MLRLLNGAVLAAVAVLLITSSAIAVGQSIDSSSSEVRINARRLDDGRTEFALQQRVDGEWGERILPRSRLFPVAPDNRWLNSSPISIETDLGSEMSGNAEGPVLREEGFVDYDNGRIGTSVRTYQDDTGASWLSSTLWIRAEEYRNEADDSAIWLAITCRAGERVADLYYVRLEPARTGIYFYTAAYAVDPPAADGFVVARDLRWDTRELYRDKDTFTVDIRLDTRFFLHIRQATELAIQLIGNGASENLTFSLDGAWDTPLQPNLDRCGDYY